MSTGEMGTSIGVFTDVFTDEVVQMLLAEDQEIVQALLLDTLDHSFAPGIQVRALYPQDLDLEPSALSTSSNGAVNFVSRSRIRQAGLSSQSEVCIKKLRTCCVTHAESGCAVELLTKISRVSTLMKTSRK